MNKLMILSILLMSMQLACSQGPTSDSLGKREKVVGGGCEGCEAIHEYGDRILNPIDTLPDFNDQGRKLKITGTIFHCDGKTPAQDVILYIYHTDQTGEYPRRGNEKGWARRHGYIRGWIKTGADGQYTFYTLRPGAYPGGENPEHIHPVIKEPGYKEYWIDEYLFDDDPILTEKFRRQQEKRGGSGIFLPTRDASGMQVVHRDIILGLNVPGYD